MNLMLASVQSRQFSLIGEAINRQPTSPVKLATASWGRIHAVI
jgi:hypothetical protein